MFSPKTFSSRYFSPKYWAPGGNHDEARFVQILIGTTVRALDPRGERVNYVMVQAEGQNVRYRDDGVAPTTAIGFILYSGDPPTKLAGAINLLKFVGVQSGAILNVRYC